MPAKGTYAITLPSYRLITTPLYKSFIKVSVTDISKDRFLQCADIAARVISEYIEHEPEGVKLPYIGLLMACRIKVTTQYKNKLAEQLPIKSKKMKFKTYLGKIGWVRYSVSRFQNYRLYKFKPDRELNRRVKQNANKSHSYMTCESMRSMREFGAMNLKIDDTITKSLKKFINGKINTK